MHYIPFNDSEGPGRSDLNDGNYILNLSTRTGMCLRGRLHNKDRKVRSHTLFFRIDGALPANGFIRETVKPIPSGMKARPRP
jgi:hypothetical protein